MQATLTIPDYDKTTLLVIFKITSNTKIVFGVFFCSLHFTEDENDKKRFITEMFDILFVKEMIYIVPCLKNNAPLNLLSCCLYEIVVLLNTPEYKYLSSEIIRYKFHQVFYLHTRKKLEERIEKARTQRPNDFNIILKRVKNYTSKVKKTLLSDLRFKSYQTEIRCEDLIQGGFAWLNLRMAYSIDTTTDHGISVTFIVDLATHLIVDCLVLKQKPNGMDIAGFINAYFTFDLFDKREYEIEIKIIHSDSGYENICREVRDVCIKKGITHSVGNKLTANQLSESLNQQLWNECMVWRVEGKENVNFEDLDFETKKTIVLYCTDLLNHKIRSHSTVVPKGKSHFCLAVAKHFTIAYDNFAQAIVMKSVYGSKERRVIRLWNRVVIKRKENAEILIKIAKRFNVKIEIGEFKYTPKLTDEFQLLEKVTKTEKYNLPDVSGVMLKEIKTLKKLESNRLKFLNMLLELLEKGEAYNRNDLKILVPLNDNDPFAFLTEKVLEISETKLLLMEENREPEFFNPLFDEGLIEKIDKVNLLFKKNIEDQVISFVKLVKDEEK